MKITKKRLAVTVLLISVNTYAAGDIKCESGTSIRSVVSDLNYDLGHSGTSPILTTIVHNGAIYYTVCAAQEKEDRNTMSIDRNNFFTFAEVLKDKEATLKLCLDINDAITCIKLHMAIEARCGNTKPRIADVQVGLGNFIYELLEKSTSNLMKERNPQLNDFLKLLIERQNELLNLVTPESFNKYEQLHRKTIADYKKIDFIGNEEQDLATHTLSIKNNS